MTPIELYKHTIDYKNGLKDTPPLVEINSKDLAVLALLDNRPQKYYAKEFHIDKKLTRVRDYLATMQERGLIIILDKYNLIDMELIELGRDTEYVTAMSRRADNDKAYMLGSIFSDNYIKLLEECLAQNKKYLNETEKGSKIHRMYLATIKLITKKLANL